MEEVKDVVVQDDPNTPAEEEVSLTPDEIKAVQEENARLKTEKTQLEGDKNGMNTQLIELRKKNQELSQTQNEDTDDDVTKKVKEVVSVQRSQDRDRNKDEAFKAFVRKHPEFHTDNDAGGVRQQVLLDAFSRLNTSESFFMSDFVRDYEDSLKLVNNEQETPDSTPMDEYANTPTISKIPNRADKSPLTPEQDKLREEKGWTVEKYLQMKEKYPKIVL